MEIKGKNMQPEFNGKKIEDLTDEEYFEFCTTVLKMEMTPAEVKEMRINSEKYYGEIFNKSFPDVDLIQTETALVIAANPIEDESFFKRVWKRIVPFFAKKSSCGNYFQGSGFEVNLKQSLAQRKR